MPEVVICSKCGRKSRLPDHLIGKRVRCPGCAEIFTAAVNVPAPVKKPEPVAKDEDDEAGGYDVVEDRPKKRRPVDDDDDDDDRSRRSRRRLDDDDDDDDDDRPRRRAPKRKKKRSPRSGAGSGNLSTLLFVGIGAAALCVLLGLVSIFVPALAMVPYYVGVGVTIVGQVWFLIVAFSDDATQGVLCLCVPFYGLYYLVTHFAECKNAFFTQLAGVALMTVGSCAAGARGGMHEGVPQPPPNFPRRM